MHENKRRRLVRRGSSGRRRCLLLWVASARASAVGGGVGSGGGGTCVVYAELCVRTRMGVQNLLPHLRPHMRPVHVSAYRGLRVAADGYSWLHKGVYAVSGLVAQGLAPWAAQGRRAPYVEYCLRRMRMLRSNGVEPVLVFDGDRLPAKSATEAERRARRREFLAQAQEALERGDRAGAEALFQRAVDVTPAMAHEVICALREEGFDFVVAPYEADSQMAYFAINGAVAAVITEDSDLAAYGAPVILFKLDAEGGALELRLEDVFAGRTHAAAENVAPPAQQQPRRARETGGCDEEEGLGEEDEAEDGGDGPAPAAAAPSCGAGKARRGGRAAGPLSFRGFTRDMFLTCCVLAGCDFVPNVRGFGIKRAHALCLKARTPARALERLRSDRKLAVPPEYPAEFRRALETFTHARVYDAAARALVPLTPLAGASAAGPGDTAHLGPDMPADVAVSIAEGRLDPITRRAFPPPSRVARPSMPFSPPPTHQQRQQQQQQRRRSSSSVGAASAGGGAFVTVGAVGRSSAGLAAAAASPAPPTTQRLWDGDDLDDEAFAAIDAVAAAAMAARRSSGGAACEAADRLQPSGSPVLADAGGDDDDYGGEGSPQLPAVSVLGVCAVAGARTALPAPAAGESGGPVVEEAVAVVEPAAAAPAPRVAINIFARDAQQEQRPRPQRLTQLLAAAVTAPLRAVDAAPLIGPGTLSLDAEMRGTARPAPVRMQPSKAPAQPAYTVVPPSRRKMTQAAAAAHPRSHIAAAFSGRDTVPFASPRPPAPAVPQAASAPARAQQHAPPPVRATAAKGTHAAAPGGSASRSKGGQAPAGNGSAGILRFAVRGASIAAAEELKAAAVLGEGAAGAKTTLKKRTRGAVLQSDSDDD